MQSTNLTFLGHLDELRSRLLKSTLAVLVASVVMYSVSDKIISFLSRFAGKTVFISPTEAFSAYLKVALWGGLFVASPFVVYQVWRFIGVGLKSNEKRYVYIFAPTSFVLFIVGVVFGFTIIIRYGMEFLLSFRSDVLEPMISINKYISFVSSTSMAFGLVFQLPLILFFLAKLGLITPLFLSEKRRYAIVLIFLVAGTLTPGPDIFSQLSMAIPLMILYETGRILTIVACRKKNSQDGKKTDE